MINIGKVFADASKKDDSSSFNPFLSLQILAIFTNIKKNSKKKTLI